jgi:beta-phosphoglucomutase
VVDSLVREKRLLFRELCRRERAGVSAGARRLVRALEGGARLAVVSSAPRSEVTGALRAAGLLHRFQVIVAAEDVRRCKPHPEGYRKALRGLGLGAGACIAVEDSPGGIAAARAAGLRTLGVATTFTARTLRRAGAFEVVPSLDGTARVLRILRRSLRGRRA